MLKYPLNFKPMAITLPELLFWSIYFDRKLVTYFIAKVSLHYVP